MIHRRRIVILGLSLSSSWMQVYQLARLRRRFDLVLFMGVLYHLCYPLLALDIVSTKVAGRLVFQSLSMPGDEVETPPADFSLDGRDYLTRPGWPKMAFIRCTTEYTKGF